VPNSPTLNALVVGRFFGVVAFFFAAFFLGVGFFLLAFVFVASFRLPTFEVFFAMVILH
jgi:hypothetical protein